MWKKWMNTRPRAHKSRRKQTISWVLNTKILLFLRFKIFKSTNLGTTQHQQRSTVFYLQPENYKLSHAENHVKMYADEENWYFLTQNAHNSLKKLKKLMQSIRVHWKFWNSINLNGFYYWWAAWVAYLLEQLFRYLHSFTRRCLL